MDNDTMSKPETLSSPEVATPQARIEKYQAAYSDWQKAESARAAKVTAYDADNSVTKESLGENDRNPIEQPPEAKRYAMLQELKKTAVDFLNTDKAIGNNGLTDEAKTKHAQLLEGLAVKDDPEKEEEAYIKAVGWLEGLKKRGESGSSQAVGEILSAKPELTESREAVEVVQQIIDKATDAKSQTAKEALDPRHRIDKIVAVAKSEASKFSPELNLQITDVGSYLEGWRTMESKIKLSRDKGSNLSGGYADVSDKVGKYDLDNIKNNTKLAGKDRPHFLPALLGELAINTSDPKDKRELQLLALGGAAYLHSEKPLAPNGVHFTTQSAAETALVDIYVSDGKPGIVEYRERNRNDFLFQELNRLEREIAGSNPHGELDRYNREVLNERYKQEEEATKKKEAEEATVTKAKQEAENAAQAAAAKAKAEALQAAIDNLNEKLMASLKEEKKLGFLPTGKFSPNEQFMNRLGTAINKGSRPDATPDDKRDAAAARQILAKINGGTFRSSKDAYGKPTILYSPKPSR